MSALSYRSFCPYDSRRVSLWDLSAGLRYTTARPSSRGSHAGWRATGRLGSVLVGLLTGGTGGLAGEARKRLQVAGALARWWQRLGWLLIPSGTLVWPGRMQHDAEPQKSQQHQLVEKQVRYHGKVPLTRSLDGGILETIARIPG